MKVAITGGTGFVGSHLAKQLVKDGHNHPEPRDPVGNEVDFLRCQHPRPPGQAAGGATRTVASTALGVANIRHAYGFDQIPNWGAGQILTR